MNDDDGYAALVQAALLNHTDLDGYLIERVKRELDEKVRRAVKMEPEWPTCSRETLQEVLANDGFPRSFADGVLVQRGFTVLETVWPDARPAAPASAPLSTAEATFRRPEQRAAHHSRAVRRMDLTRTPGCARSGTTTPSSELLGIAGAQVDGGGTTVIAVPTREPATHEETQLREAFGVYYGDRRVRLISAVASTYDEIVRAWFKKVDSWPRRLVVGHRRRRPTRCWRSTSTRAGSSAEEREAGVWVGRESDREALRRLLPYERVEFVAADAG